MQIPMILLIDDCTVKPLLGDAPTGPSYGTVQTYKCKFEEHRKKYKDKNGKEVISEGKLFLPHNSITSVLLPDSEITIEGVLYYVLIRSPLSGFSPSHVKCILI